jgi:hypothetical protein
MSLNPRELGRLLKPDNRAWTNMQDAVLTHSNGWVLRVVEVQFRPRYCSLITQIIDGEPKVHNFNTEALANGAFVTIELDQSKEDALAQSLRTADAADRQCHADQAKREEQRKLVAKATQEKYLARVRAEEAAAVAGIAAKHRADEERRAQERERKESDEAARANRVGEWQRCLRERGIRRLTHVTRVQNLASILLRGLFPVSQFDQLSSEPVRNDPERMDRRLHAVSLSVTHPNDLLFERWHTYKFRDNTWVVLSIHPSVMWELPCALFVTNAATACGTGAVSTSLQPVASDFEHLFAEQSGGLTRATLGHNDADTTDPQAEVMIVGIISPNYIESVHVQSTYDLGIVRPVVREHWKPEGALEVAPWLFSKRPYAAAFSALRRKARSSATAPQVSPVKVANDFDDDIPF